MGLFSFRRFAPLCLWGSLIAFSGTAQAIELMTTTDGTTFRVVLKNEGSDCGMTIHMGDGSSIPVALWSGKNNIVEHRYSKPGSYDVNAKPAKVATKSSTLPGCARGFSLQASVRSAVSADADAKTSIPASSKSLNFYVKSAEPGLEILKRLDGALVFQDPQLLPIALDYCIIKRRSTFTEQDELALDKVVVNEIRGLLKTLQASPDRDLRPVTCVQSSQNVISLDPRPAFVVIEADLAVEAASIQGWQEYLLAQNLGGDRVTAGMAVALREERVERISMAQRQQLFNGLAASGSQTHLAAISLRYPIYRGALRVCSRQLSVEGEQAALGYLATDSLPLSQDFIVAAAVVNATIDRASPITQTYKDLNALYLEWQQDPSVCHVLIDYPEQLQEFIQATSKKFPLKYELNPVTEVSVLRAQRAEQLGYKSLADMDFGNRVMASPAQLSDLSAYDVTEQVSYEMVVKRMNQARYSLARDAGTVLSFLDDELQAKQSRTTAVAIKKKRDRALAIEAKKRRQAEAKARALEAKRHPYYAVLSCELGDDAYDILGCFAASGTAGRDTTIKVIVTGVEREYQLDEIANNGVGTVTNAGLQIKLSPKFYIQAQNASESFVLRLRIYQTVNNSLVSEKLAPAQYRVVSYRR